MVSNRMCMIICWVLMTGGCDDEPPPARDLGSDVQLLDLAARDASVDLARDTPAPDTMSPDKLLPDLPVPDRLLPDLPVPDAMVPDLPVPDTQVPDLPVPDLPVPDLLVPDTRVPDQLVPDLLVPDLLVPDLLVPDLLVPDQLVPDQLVPDMPLPTCTDGVKNGAETDVDCGGGTCPGCGVGHPCVTNADCAGKVCFMGVCIDPKGTLCGSTTNKVLPSGGFKSIRIHAASSAMRGIGTLVADDLGNLFGQDPYGNGTSGDRVLKITPAGTVTSFSVVSGMSTCTVSQIARDGSGMLYLYDITSHHILKFTGSGAWSKHSSFASLGGGGSCSNTSVIGLVANADGSLIAGSPKAGKLYRVSSNGTSSTVMATVPQAMRLDHDGSGGVLAISGGKLLRATKAGVVSTFFDPSAGPGSANTLRRDASGEVYFHASGTVYKLNSGAAKLTPVVSCLPGLTDITFGKATSTAAGGTSLYLVHVGQGIAAFDGDQILELQR